MTPSQRIAKGVLVGVAAWAMALAESRPASAQSPDVQITSPAAAGVRKGRFDLNPGLAGDQIARRVAAGTFDIDIRVYNTVEAIVGFHATIHYDPAAVSFVQVVPPGMFGGDSFPGSFFPGPPGQVRVVTSIDPCGAGASGSGTLVRLRFATVAPHDRHTGFDISDVELYKRLSPCGGTPPLISFDATDMKAVAVVGGSTISCLNVNVVADTASINTGTYNPRCNAAMGNGDISLRSALQIANAVAGGNRITFRVPGASPTLTAGAALPFLSDASGGTYLDGSTQPMGMVQITSGAVQTLNMTSANNTIDRLAVVGNAAGIGIRVGGNGNKVIGSRVGIDPADAPNPNDTGIVVTTGINHQIGGTGANEPNTISGNTRSGLLIVAPNGVKVIGNRIGTNAAGGAAVPNADGVEITGGTGNEIGGTAAGEVNVISGNTMWGVKITGGTGALVRGNRIGTNPAGTAAVGNGGGVLISGSNNNVVGGSMAGARNIISGSNNVLGSGVEINSGATSNLVQGNYIGTDVVGTAALFNSYAGVFINGAPGNTIGGTLATDGNLISGNGDPAVIGIGYGVLISGAASSANLVQNNYIGTNAAGNATVANREDGVRVEVGAHDNQIGTVGAGNLISGNRRVGIHITGPGTNANLVRANSIGTDAAGTAPLPNAGTSGIRLDDGAKFNEIGGSLGGMQNLIAANAGDGIRISGTAVNPDTNANRVEYNRIGGEGNLGNGIDGVSILSGVGNVVENNSILGNARHGVQIAGAGTDQHEILANFIGSVSAPNGGNGVDISLSAEQNIVSRNNIGNNARSGIFVGGADGTTITANIIMGNSESGVVLDAAATATYIGGASALAANDINGNLEHGILILDGMLTPIRGNTIRNNDLSGVTILAGEGNAIRANAIYDNQNAAQTTALGIELGADGVTANDPGDADAGPNTLQNYPVLAFAVADTASVTVSGSLNSAADTAYELDFYANTACDPSGNGEGRTYLGSATVTTDATGEVDFSISVADSAIGDVITATATAAGLPQFPDDGNTSEFSNCVTVVPAWPTCLTCPGDLNGDGSLDGLDIQPFVNCWLASAGPPEAACACADVDGDSDLDMDDVAAIVDLLLTQAGEPCT